MTTNEVKRHLALIVEDDPRTAEMMGEIVSAAGCDHEICDNSADAIRLFNERRYCVVLLDLSIKGAPHAMKDNTANGRAVLEEIRKRSPHHTGVCWWLPIIVVSGHLGDRDGAIAVMAAGAATIIDKQFEERVLTKAIRDELARSGRADHSGCASRPVPPAFYGSDFSIRLPGTRVGRRTVVYIGEGRIELTNADLLTLLQLIVVEGKGTHKNDLGAKSDRGFHQISRLRGALKPILGNVEIIANDHHGRYQLIPGARVIEFDAAALAAIGDHRITPLAQTISRSRSQAPKR